MGNLSGYMQTKLKMAFRAFRNNGKPDIARQFRGMRNAIVQQVRWRYRGR